MEHMLPFPTVAAAYLLALTFCLSAFVGLIAGELLRIFSRAVHPRSVLNAILGAVGFLGGFILCVLVPLPENTVYENLPGGGVVATTMTRYQHPYWVGFMASALLPFGHELCRTLWRRSANSAVRGR